MTSILRKHREGLSARRGILDTPSGGIGTCSSSSVVLSEFEMLRHSRLGMWWGFPASLLGHWPSCLMGSQCRSLRLLWDYSILAH